MEYNDFIELATFINMWDLADKEHQERSRSEFRQFMVAMVDKGPDHLIGIWRLYMKTLQLDEKSYEEQYDTFIPRAGRQK